MKYFSEFAKGIYKICDRYFCNLGLIIFLINFSVVQFILFLRFASNNQLIINLQKANEI